MNQASSTTNTANTSTETKFPWKEVIIDAVKATCEVVIAVSCAYAGASMALKAHDKAKTR